MTTKENIIFESLKLFSVDGFEVVSTRMIARAIGASDAVIYKHFKSKQEIFDCIVEKCLERYSEYRSQVNVEQMDWSDVEKVCMEMFHFQTTDEWIKPFRRLLILEQFKNPKMADIYKKIFVDIPISTMSAMFEQLIGLGYMKEGNTKVYAMELYSPFFLCHNLSDEDGEIEKMLKIHVSVFCKNVRV